MSAEKSLALVLRVIDFSETSAVVTLFTRDFGKIQALAKGARRPKGPFESALDLLALIRVVFLPKSSDALNLLTEAKLERRFRVARAGLSGLYAAYYVAELLRELTHDNDPHPELFDLAEQALAEMGVANSSEPSSVAQHILKFEVTALRLVGHMPSLDACAECGAPIEPVGRVAFGHTTGGVLCTNCRPGKRNVVSLSPGAWKALRNLSEEESSTTEDEPMEPIDRAVRGELRGVLKNYIAHLVGRPLKLPALLT